MLPIRATFERFRRLVHDLARDLHKDVELTFEGADTELDKTVIDQLSDPFMHLIRNSMDHGIEDRLRAAVAAGKAPDRHHPPFGSPLRRQRVLMRHRRRSRHRRRGGARASHRKGPGRRRCELTEAGIFPLILAPDFPRQSRSPTSPDAASGMDVVRRSVESLARTHRRRQQARDRAPASTLRLPLTLAIIDGCWCALASAFFVLPWPTPLECIELTRQDIEKANGKHLANVRGEIIPYVRLSEYLQPAHRAARARADHGGRNRTGPLRVCGRPGARRPPDGDQESGPVLPATCRCFRRHHSRRRQRWR